MLTTGGHRNKRQKPCQKETHNPTGEYRQMDNYNIVY